MGVKFKLNIDSYLYLERKEEKEKKTRADTAQTHGPPISYS